MYQVNGQKFEMFMQAVRFAQQIGAEVFEVETGIRRWHPAPKVDAKRARRYTEQKAAYEAQQK
jgi:hypothetical protein